MEKEKKEGWKTPRVNMRPEGEETMGRKGRELEVRTGKTVGGIRGQVVLYDEEEKRHRFPVMYDGDIGIKPEFQNIFIPSNNDDDRKTTTTQMMLGMSQTYRDLVEAVENSHTSQYSFNQTQ